MSNPVSKFFEGEIDVIDQTMKSRIIDILDKYHKQHKGIDYQAAEEILQLFSDLIQTTREEYKHQILSELNTKATIDKYKDRDLALMRIQQQLRDYRSAGLERF